MTTATIKQRATAIATAIIMGFFGLTSIASANTISNTGPNSTNTITTTKTEVCNITNVNNIDVESANHQTAVTGDAVVSNNTTAGSAETGDAVNENASEFIVNISNDSAFIGPVEGASQPPVVPVETLFDECGNPIHGPGSGGSGGGVSNTGPGSSNRVKYESRFVKNHNNKNYVRAGLGNSQWARSGSAQVKRNTNGGGGVSGAAHNTNAPAATVAVANTTPAGGSGGGGGGCGCPAPVAPSSSSISNTGPNSNNTIYGSTSSNTTVNNTNNVSYSSYNNQTAVSGNATVSSNTSAGSAGTGVAANSNDTYGAVAIAN